LIYFLASESDQLFFKVLSSANYYISFLFERRGKI